MMEITREHFCQQFAHAQSELRLTDLELAQLFQVSLPTIGRWRKGEAAPYPIGREPILNALRLRGAKIEAMCPLDRSVATQIETYIDSTPGKGGPG